MGVLESVVGKRGSHVRPQKRVWSKVIKVTVPTHAFIKKSTLARIIRDAGLTAEEFKGLV